MGGVSCEHVTAKRSGRATVNAAARSRARFPKSFLHLCSAFIVRYAIFRAANMAFSFATVSADFVSRRRGGAAASSTKRLAFVRHLPRQHSSAGRSFQSAGIGPDLMFHSFVEHLPLQNTRPSRFCGGRDFAVFRRLAMSLCHMPRSPDVP